MPNAPQKHNPPPARDLDRRPAHLRGYDHAWREVRLRRLQLEPWCRECEKNGRVEVNNLEVDHIEPMHVRPDLRLAIENTQTLCKKHHREKTEADIKKYGAAR